MLKHIIYWIKSLGRRQKQILMIFADMLLLPFSFWLSVSLQFGYIPVNSYWSDNWGFFLIIIVSMIPMFIHYGLYRAVLKYMGYQVILATVKSVSVSCMFLGLLFIFSNELLLSQSAIVIFWFVTILNIIASRYLMKSFLYLNEPVKKSIAIYGAGKAGAQLINNLRVSSEFIPIALFDDDPAKWGTVVNSVWVYAPSAIEEVIEKNNIGIILVGILGISKEERKIILQRISDYPVQVRMISSIENLISGNFNLSSIRSVEVEDILGRDIVKPNKKLLSSNLKNKNILVTGAGGSIGRELCKQIVNLNPRKIIILENNEYALYKVQMEIKKYASYIKIIPVLSSVLDYIHLKDILMNNQIHTVYHAAAYKHVPLVENNPLDGIKNNILGTYYCVKASLEANIDNFILISTDKAVRPANIMGATKRYSELILQGAQRVSSGTCFSIVRFGNVLNSAGSVVPLFKEQIQKGGPITVTHPDVARYFMSIPEAVELVIQAGAMARGGEVFVLEMGEPIRIYDLAIKMIHLSGYQHKDNRNIHGDIEIKISGLRQGEKIDEELIIGNNVYETEHPQILKADEKFISWEKIEELSIELIKFCKTRELSFVLEILQQAVSDWKPAQDILLYKQNDVDLLFDKNSDVAEC